MQIVSLKTKTGFTLVELLVSVIIFSLVIGAMTMLLKTGLNARDQALRSASLQDQAQGAVDSIVMATLDSKQVVSANGNDLTLTDHTGNTITFAVSNGDLNSKQGTDQTLLASNVTLFTITPQAVDSNGATYSTTADNATQLEISLELADSSNTKASVCTVAHLRNK